MDIERRVRLRGVEKIRRGEKERGEHVAVAVPHNKIFFTHSFNNKNGFCFFTQRLNVGSRHTSTYGVAPTGKLWDNWSWAGN